MTRYEVGFMNKCAEYGVDPTMLAKFARESRDHGKGAVTGAKIGLIGGGALGGAAMGGAGVERVLKNEAFKKAKLKGKLMGLVGILGLVGSGAASVGVPAAMGGAAIGGLIGQKRKNRFSLDRIFKK